MDSDLQSPADNAGAKPAFHKPSNDSSNRKYRRRSPASGSSSSDGEPVHERSSTPTKDDKRDIDRDHKRSRYGRDVGSTRTSDRRSYNDRRHDDYKRREKYADEDQKNYKLSPRSRGSRGSYVDKYSRDKSDGSGHRSRDKKDDEKRDHRSHRSSHHHKETSWRDTKEIDDPKCTRFEKSKSYNQETRGVKDRHFKEPKELLDDKTVLAARKSKFSMDKDTEYIKDDSKHATVANEVQSSSSKQGQDSVGKVNAEQEFVKESDIDAAKIAAMKAAELVNRNLIGTGFMSTDQKKKLLWGSKKSTTPEESGHRWDTSMFSDRERQEKFKKLMSLRWLNWYIWPIVGCKSGAETRGFGHQCCREAEGAAGGAGETVHCWSSSQRWPHCWVRSLSLYLIMLYLCAVLPHYAFKLCYPFEFMILSTTNFLCVFSFSVFYVVRKSQHFEKN